MAELYGCPYTGPRCPGCEGSCWPKPKEEAAEPRDPPELPPARRHD